MPDDHFKCRVLFHIAMGLLLLTSCNSTQSDSYTPPDETDRRPFIARRSGSGVMHGMAELNRVFSASNHGYSISHSIHLAELVASKSERLAFIQSSEGSLRLSGDPIRRDVQVGDIIRIAPGQTIQTADPLEAVIFQLPQSMGAQIPVVVSPDNDPCITDTPGGCAEEEEAYRRICLTWLKSRGQYICHDLNAHRVRIKDSFTHYHPLCGGFDEFYLVQSAPKGARLLTSTQTRSIENPESVSSADAQELLQEWPLHTGDVVYLPRTVIHRGVGGAVIHVIAVPGFKPGGEIGVDHHLSLISTRTGVTLPVNRASMKAPKIK